MSSSKYSFQLDNYEIKDTRSRHEDTNYVTAALSVDGVPIGSPQTRFMGNQNNGTFNVGFSWLDVDVPDGGTVVMLYQILNSGHKDHAELENALSQVTQLAISGTPVSWVEQLGEKVARLLFPDCDGPIAPPEGRKIEFSSFDLKSVLPGTPFLQAQDEAGNPSPAGCGRNSHYIVHYVVTAS